MPGWIDWVLYIVLLPLMLAGLGLNLLGLPGIWLIVLGTALFGVATGWDVHVGWPLIWTLTGIGVVAEAIEFLAGAAGSKSAGGSKRGMAGALAGGLVGGIVGTPIFPIVGTIVGSIAGSFAGAFAVEMLVGRSRVDSTSIGIGAAKGRFWGILVKSALGAAMALIAAIWAFPIRTDSAVSAAPAATLPAATRPATDQGG